MGLARWGMDLIVSLLLIVPFTSVSVVISSLTRCKLLTGLRDRVSESLFLDISYDHHLLLHNSPHRGKDCIHLAFGFFSAMTRDSNFIRNLKLSAWGGQWDQLAQHQWYIHFWASLDWQVLSKCWLNWKRGSGMAGVGPSVLNTLSHGILKSWMKYYNTREALHKRKLKSTQNPTTQVSTAIFISLHSELTHSKT